MIILEALLLRPAPDDFLCAGFRDRKAGKPWDFIVGISLSLKLDNLYTLLLCCFSSFFRVRREAYWVVGILVGGERCKVMSQPTCVDCAA
jgi:hypothetical protein